MENNIHKYATYIIPDKKLHNKLKEYKHFFPPPLGTHLTIFNWYMDEKHESNALNSLTNFEWNNFIIKSKSIESFDSDSLVLTFSNNPTLQSFHEHVISIALKYVKDPDRLQKRIDRYFGVNYHPHITFSRPSLGNAELPKIKDYLMNVKEMIIAKKTDGKWEIIEKLSSSSK